MQLHSRTKLFGFNPFGIAYYRFANQFGFELTTQTSRNLARLTRELREKRYIRAGEENLYPIGTSLNPQERALFAIWRNQLVPTATLKHAAKEIHFDTLTPLAIRHREQDAVNLMHTPQGVEQEFTYFTLGFGNAHPTPTFLGNSTQTETITVDIGKMIADGKDEPLLGLWIGTWHGRYERAECSEPFRLGDVILSISHTRDFKKRFLFQYPDGSKVEYLTSFAEEIFAADKNLASIFDGLFFQLLLIIRLAGGAFREYVYEHANDPKIIADIFHALFESQYYPEAKLPRKLVLNSPYVHISKREEMDFSLPAQWFAAANSGDIATLTNLLNQGININLRNEGNESALNITLHYSHFAAAQFLLSRGAEITKPDLLNRLPFMCALETASEYIIDLFFAGIPHPNIPVIARLPLTKPFCIGAPHPLKAAFAKRRNNYIARILQDNQPIDPNLPIIEWAYSNGSPEQLSVLIQSGANVDAGDTTAFMHAAENGDVVFAQALVTHQADINATVKTPGEHEGWTAVFFAAYDARTEFLAYLNEIGARFDIQDARGNTAYMMVCATLKAGFEGYITTNAIGHEQLLQYYEKYTKAREDKKPIPFSIHNPASIMAFGTVSQWETLEKKLRSAKDFFDNNFGAITLPKTELHLCKNKIRIVAAIITGTIRGEKHTILVRKRLRNTATAHGYWLGAGGFYDVDKDPDHESAVRREIAEELSISLLADQAVTEVYRYQNIHNSTFTEIVFFHVDLGSKLATTRLAAKDDVAVASRIKITDIEMKTFPNGMVGYFYRGIRIMQSNALLLFALANQQPIDTQQIDQALQSERNSNLALAKSVKENDYETLRQLYYQGVDFSHYLFLKHACISGNAALVHVLLELGCLVDQHQSVSAFKAEFTPLMICIALRHNDLAKQLIEQYHADINLLVGNNSAIGIAIKFGNTNMRDYLLASKAVLKQGIGGNALFEAILIDDVASVEILLATKQIDLNIKYQTFT
jgi:ankyrin repeat protein